MKNSMKKIFSTIIVFLMAFALIVPTGASDKVDPKNNPKIDPKIKNGSIEIAKKGSVFSVYKILNAEAKEGQNVFNYTVNKDFAENENHKGFFGNDEYGNLTIKDISKMPNELNIRNKYGTITDPITSATTKLTNPLQEFISDNNIAPVATIDCPNDGSAVKVDGLGIGFYLIVETDTHSDSASVASKAMLVPLPMVVTVEGANVWNYDLKITPKDEPVNITKKIVEGDNRVDESTNFIGERINYEIKADIPHYDASTDISKVEYIMTDTLSKGLDFDKEVAVKVVVPDGRENIALVEGTDYTIDYSEDNKTMTITYKYANIMKYTDVTVTYAAKLNKNALIGGGNLANPNKIELEYTNNPKTETTSKPWDEVKSFTYGLKINKVDDDKENPKKLAGAEFQLLDGENEVIATYTFDEDGKLIPNTEEGKTAVTGSEFLDNEGKEENPNFGIAYLIGIKAGTYTLKETKAPDGYIIPNDGLILKIVENYDTNGNRAVSYKLGIDEDNLNELETEKINNESIADGSVAVTSITNSEGFNLPMTGGAGTWMFTVGGILIMASMVTVFVKLRRKEN